MNVFLAPEEDAFSPKEGRKIFWHKKKIFFLYKKMIFVLCKNKIFLCRSKIPSNSTTIGTLTVRSWYTNATLMVR